MPFFDYTINISKVKIFAIVLILCVISSTIIFIIFSYFIIKFLQLSINDNSIFFYKYNKKSQNILDTYGDCKICKFYLCREPFNKFIHFVINILTFYNYEKLISISDELYPYHSRIIVKLITLDKKYKFVSLDKNNCINITTDFNITNKQEYKLIKIKKHHTLNSILSQTLNRVGNNTFFNWNLYKNNCLNFSREILVTLNKLNKGNKQFIACDKILGPLNPSDFTLHMINCSNTLCSIMEKYIYDNNLFS
jgi:hypothetical protein